jgi:hypothetical protein
MCQNGDTESTSAHAVEGSPFGAETEDISNLVTKKYQKEAKRNG